MSEYYTPPDDIVPFTKVKSSQINELKESVKSGFDNLPTDLSGLKQEIIDAREGRESLFERLIEAEAATSADVISCDEILSECQDELLNCKVETSNCIEQTYLSTEQAKLAKKYLDYVIFSPEVSSSLSTATIGTGIKSLTVEPEKDFTQDMWIIAVDRTAPENYMKGYISSYDSVTGDLNLAAVQVQGTGCSSSSWLVSQTSPAVASEYSPVSFKGLVMAEMF